MLMVAINDQPSERGREEKIHCAEEIRGLVFKQEDHTVWALNSIT